MEKRYALPADGIARRNAEERVEVEENLAEFGEVFNPWTDSASRIHYLNAKYGARGWATFLDKMDQAEKERVLLSVAS